MVLWEWKVERFMSRDAVRAVYRLGHTNGFGRVDEALDYRRDVREAVEAPEGFIDLSESLRGGVYLLALAGEVVYVGEATGWMLDAIAAKLGPQPRFLPKIRFDQILIRPCHPDQIAGLRAELIATYRPRFNSDPRSLVHPISRRAI
jgi:hypothetical protein